MYAYANHRMVTRASIRAMRRRAADYSSPKALNRSRNSLEAEIRQLSDDVERLCTELEIARGL